MSSLLENTPCDVLQYISVLASSSSPFDPPVEILRLMQTGPVLYQALNIHGAPHVYAQTFASKFDTTALSRRYRSTITDSALAAELVNRLRLLKRCKRRDVSAQNLLKDLSTALWMYLESDGRNELQLLNVGFPDFILSVARTHLKCTSPRETYDDLQPALIGRIIVWLLSFALSRRFIFKIPELGREELYALIFPFILSSEKTIPSFSRSVVLDSRGFSVPTYRLPHAAFIPSPYIPAGNLASVIFESGRMKMPYHLPETRGMHVQEGMPTKSDFRAFAAYETPLFADSLNPDDLKVVDMSGTPRSALHDLELRPLLLRTPLDASYPEIRYVLGSLTAVWEGVFRTIGAPAGSAANEALFSYSAFVKPIQCSLHEYVNDERIPSKGQGEPLSLSEIFLNQDGSELEVRGCKYRKHDALKNSISEPRVHDVILHGETLENHDHAWGGYKFWGVVDEDGRVALKRAAKDHSSQGIWEFDGRLRFGSVLIGRWRMTGNSDNAYNGIFSMTRM